MTRVLLVSGLAVALSFASIASSAQAPSTSSGSVPGTKRTLDEAITAIQSKESHSGSTFRLIREIPSSATMRESDVGGGVFIDLMRSGGFVILEVDDKSDRAISLHLVSRAADGHPVVESNAVVGEVSATLAQKLIRETSDLVDVLLSAPIDATAVESKFDGSRFPVSHDADDDQTNNLFAVPSVIENIGTDQSEIRELAVLLGAIDTWPIRYALSTPLFLEDPPGAIDAGARELDSLSRQFFHRKKASLDGLHILQDLRSVTSSEQLRSRVSTLRLLDNFLEKTLASPDALMTSTVSRLIATIPLKLAFSGPPDSSYAVMTSSGIIVAWKVASGGAPVVMRMGLAGD